MGYNTAVLVLNDALDTIRDHPQEFVDNLFQQVAKGKEGEIPTYNHANVARVMQTAHADIPRLYFSQGNLLTDLLTSRDLDQLDELQFSVLQERVTQAGELLSRARAQVTAEAGRRNQLAETKGRRL